MKFIQQYDESDCGPACLAMLAHYYGKKTLLSRIREWTKTDKEGTSLYGIIEGGKHLGINITGVKAENTSDIDNSELPMIAHIINDQGYMHFVIIEKKTKNNLHIIDPAKGKEKIKFMEFEKKWTGILMLVQNDNSYGYDDNVPSKSKVFITILKNNKGIITNIFLLSLFINLLGITGAFYFKYLVDAIIPSRILENLHIISIAVLFIYLLNAFISLIRYQVSLNLSLKIDLNFMKDYYYHVLNLPVKFYETRKSGEILSRFSDLSHIREALSSVTITLLVDTLMVIVGGTILFIQSPFLFYITLLLIPIYLTIGLSFRRFLKKYNREVMEEDATLSAYLIESFSGYQVIKSFGSENEVFKKGVHYFKNLISKLYKLSLFTNIQLTINSFMKMTTTLVIFWIGSSLVIKNELTLGELLTFNALVIYYIDPIERLINLQPQIQSALVATQRYLDITDIQTEDDEKLQYNPKFLNQLEIHNLSFQYNFTDTTLKNINMIIPKNHKVAIIGESGSGKSTIAKLIDSFYKDYEGQIKIDNTSIRDISKKSLRSMISFVTQNNFIFGATIRENLTIGLNRNISDEEIYNACKIVCANDFIDSLPQKLDTQLHNGGANLSGGQLQRIALARAIIKDSDILLLDEATSSLDSSTEKMILENIETKISNKTIILITHKLNNVKNANNIYFLKHGEVIEQGSHDTLIESKGEYYKLWKNQF
ncbi:peptidase domain-containing ABC transporter [Staphylococcus xylosus]|uniref:peptidase domain-containing ABC transporter n=1 Tax=Staphylococcus xylosus TaxID=1288 RepID=UPI0010720CF7|nr:peptidase domain-containing ABC transporter [Staphylococcus xylosus]MBF0811968.1 peptidase domain-containing ABC transporter [Staphylococcus xylosus]TFV19962.1 peptidase domain-containing ABC transporter [Staphylococcus xylosus]